MQKNIFACKKNGIDGTELLEKCTDELNQT